MKKDTLDPTNTADRSKILGFENEAELEIFTQNTTNNADEWLNKNKTRLEYEAKQRSEQFANVHKNELNSINIDKLAQISPETPVLLEEKEILFLRYINNINTDTLNIAGYWTHKYHLEYQSVLEKLFKCGYLHFGDIKDSIAIFKVKDIKDFLTAKGLSVNGKKQDLIDRICENCTEEEIRQSFPIRVFKITASGEDLIAKTSI